MLLGSCDAIADFLGSGPIAEFLGTGADESVDESANGGGGVVITVRLLR
jgi:hypothetical protein